MISDADAIELNVACPNIVASEDHIYQNNFDVSGITAYDFDLLVGQDIYSTNIDVVMFPCFRT